MTQEIPRRLRQRVIRGKKSMIAPIRDRDPELGPGVDKDGISPTFRAAAEWAWRIVIISAALALGIYVLGKLSIIVIPFLVAFVLTVGLFPIFSFLVRVLRFPRMGAALVTVLLLMSAVVGMLVLAGRGIYSQFSDLWVRALEGIDRLVQWTAAPPLHLDLDQVTEWIDKQVASLSDYSGILASGALSVTASIGTIVTGAILALFLMIFFLKDGRHLWVWCVRIMPQPWREPVHEAAIRGFITMQGYVKSTLLVAAIDATGIGISAALLGVPLALPIAILVFIGSFVPFVGALITGSIAVLVALVDKGPTTALLMILAVLLVQQIEGNVLQPLIMGRSVSLHPMVVVLAVAGGAYLAGIAGAVFAVPLVALVNTVVLYMRGYDQFPDLATNPDRPGGAPGTLDALILASYGLKAQSVRDGDAAVSASAETGAGQARASEGV